MSIESIIGIICGIIGKITSAIAPWFIKFPYVEVYNDVIRKDS